MIKFRVFDKRYNTYLSPAKVGNMLWDALKSNDYIIELATGLQDKNGVDIYHGDIVKYEDYFIYSMGGIDSFENIAEVSHDIFEGIILTNYKDDEGNLANDFREETFNQGYKEFWQSVEVIGNINENKELLE